MERFKDAIDTGSLKRWNHFYSSKNTQENASKLTLREALNIDKEGRFSTVDWLPISSIFVYHKGESPFDAVELQLNLRDLRCLKTLLQSVAEALKIKNGIVERLKSNTGREIYNPLDLIPGDAYAAHYSAKHSGCRHPLEDNATFESTVKDFALLDQQNIVDFCEQNYMRIFAFRPYVPIYLKQSDVDSYGDLLHTISWHYGFPIQSIHHLDGMEVRCSWEILPEKVFITVEKTEESHNCEYVCQQGQNRDCNDRADDVPRNLSQEMVDMVIYVRSLYSYRGNLQRQTCSLLKGDLTSMPHLLSILASMLHPPGHYFSRLFDKNRKQIVHPLEIQNGEEYLALPHIVSHSGWNYLHKLSPDVGWLWNGADALAHMSSTDSFSDSSSPSGNLSRKSSTLCIPSDSPSKHEKFAGHRPDDNFSSDSSSEILDTIYPTGLTSPAEENAHPLLGICPHSNPTNMHELTPEAIIAAFNDYAIVMCAFPELAKYNATIFPKQNLGKFFQQPDPEENLNDEHPSFRTIRDETSHDEMISAPIADPEAEDDSCEQPSQQSVEITEGVAQIVIRTKRDGSRSSLESDEEVQTVIVTKSVERHYKVPSNMSGENSPRDRNQIPADDSDSYHTITSGKDTPLTPPATIASESREYLTVCRPSQIRAPPNETDHLPPRKRDSKSGLSPNASSSFHEALNQLLKGLQASQERALRSSSSDSESQPSSPISYQKRPRQRTRDRDVKEHTRSSPARNDYAPNKPELLLAPSLISLCNMIIMLLEIVLRIMNRVLAMNNASRRDENRRQ